MAQFPVKNPFDARDVTQTNFDIHPYQEQLYVDLDEVRYERFDQSQMNFLLSINKGVLHPSVSPAYKKILYSGHIGCGKSIELRKLHGELNNPNRYLSIFINLERETDLYKFQSEDLFVLLITKLTEEIRLKKLDFDVPSFEEIAKDWVSEQSIKEDLKETYKLDLASETSLGVSFLSFLSIKTGLKSIFGSESTTVREIRRKIKNNPVELIKNFNNGLAEVRAKLKNCTTVGNDILFIIDGSEKIRYPVYEELFINNRQSIRDLKVNIICSVPINSFYNINNSTAQDTFHPMLLPMVKINNHSTRIFRQIITKRLDEKTFFTNKDVLDYCVNQSGGCPRQLIKIVHQSVIRSLGEKISMETAQKTVRELGRMMRDLLKKEHLEILESEKFDNSDQATLELLLCLALLKYNGKRVINPILKPFIKK